MQSGAQFTIMATHIPVNTPAGEMLSLKTIQFRIFQNPPPVSRNNKEKSFNHNFLQKQIQTRVSGMIGHSDGVGGSQGKNMHKSFLWPSGWSVKKPNWSWVVRSSVGAWRNWEPGGQTWLKMDQVSYFKLRRRDERGKNGSRSHFAPPSRGRLAHLLRGNRRRAGRDDGWEIQDTVTDQRWQTSRLITFDLTSVCPAQEH